MTNNNEELTGKEKRWCILRHPKSDLIADIFSGKRKVYNPSDNDKYPLPPFDYFVPFDDLKNRRSTKKPTEKEEYKTYDAMLDEGALRNDLHHYIFIREPKERVLQILDAPWCKSLSQRLYAYRDEKGVPIEVSNAEVERFKAVIKRYDFQIINGEPTDELHEGDAVTVLNGPMEGKEGIVTRIREKGGQILLTIEFSMFQNKLRVAIPDISITDVRLNVQETQQLLQDPVIVHFEDELIEMLCHLHGKNGSRELNKEDHKRLKFLYQYSDIVFEDNEESRAKFAALMLICAYLQNNKDEVQRRFKEVESLTSDIFPLTSELDCYLVTAQFIVTHNPELRTKAKAWRQRYPDCSLSIRRFISIAKQIRC
jgi:transcription antitermination factor NusG